MLPMGRIVDAREEGGNLKPEVGLMEYALHSTGRGDRGQGTGFGGIAAKRRKRCKA